MCVYVGINVCVCGYKCVYAGINVCVCGYKCVCVLNNE